MMHKYLLRPDVRKPDEKKFSDLLKLMEFAVKLPLSVDLRSKLLTIFNQLNLGACQSFAIDAIIAYIHQLLFEPSHLFTYYGVREDEGTTDQDTGGTLSGTIDSVAKRSICDSQFWPYIVNNFSQKPPQDAYDNAKKLGITISNKYRVETIDEMRQALALGHLVYIGITVYESFESQKCMSTGIIPAPAGGVLGGHALVIASYFDKNVTKKCLFGKGETGTFIIRNSWGTGIGLNGSGYFSATYEILEKLLQDAWIIVK